MTQGDHIAMIAYGLVILPLIKDLKRDLPDVNLPWYADDSVALGTFAIIEAYFHSLKRQGPVQGHYTEPSKSILIVHLGNLNSVKLFGVCHGFKVCTGMHYIGGFVEDNESKHGWLKDHTSTWDRIIFTFRKTAGEYPQDSYSAVVLMIQS